MLNEHTTNIRHPKAFYIATWEYKTLGAPLKNID